VANAPKKAVSLAVAVLVGVGLLALPACSQVGDGTFHVTAEFDRAPGLYPGGAVRLLGIDVGHITDVVNDGDAVRVEMDLEDGTEVPADAHAVIIPLTLLGERYVQLAPVYEGGPQLESGDTIPMDRTRLPAEVDDLLRGLDEYLGSIDPNNAGELITNLAEIVDGQGAELNDLIQNAHATIDVLSDKGEELGHVVDALAGLTGTLATRTESIQELITSYSEVSGVLADNAEDVDAFVVQLDRAAVALASLLEDNQTTIDADVDVIATITSTLQRNIDSLERTLTATPQLFAAAQRAYDPDRNLLPLNNQADVDTTSALYLSRIRDRLAGICRRLVANFSFAGNVVLEACGDITSGFFDGVLIDSLEEARAPEPSTPQVDDLLPEGVTPPVAPPTIPDVGTLVGGALQLLGELLDPAQLAALGELTPALLEAIANLSPEQLVALLQAAPEELAQLRDVAEEELPFALDRLLQELVDPATMLDQPILPEEDEGNVSQLVEQLLGGGR
jgi:phospholipid/cholesterol/gamma-HCH transport system substrate-binding protein